MSNWKELVARAGDKLGEMGPRQLWEAAKEAHSTDDFSNILANSLEKKFFAQFKSWEPQWQKFCGVESVNKLVTNIDRPMLSEMHDLYLKPQGANIRQHKLTDNKLTIQCKTYATGIKITRETIINDDLGVLRDIGTRSVRAAQRTLDGAVASYLVANSTAYDSVAFFASSAWTAGHANSGTTALARTLAGAQAVVDGVQAIRKQKDILQRQRIGLRAKYLVVPIELEDEARVLVGNPVIANTTEASATTSLANPLYGQGLELVVFDALSDYDTTNWYLFTDPGVLPGVIVALLNGQIAPKLLTRKQLYENNGVDAYGNPACDYEYDVLYDFGVNWGDPRAAYGSIVSGGSVSGATS